MLSSCAYVTKFYVKPSTLLSGLISSSQQPVKSHRGPWKDSCVSLPAVGKACERADRHTLVPLLRWCAAFSRLLSSYLPGCRQLIVAPCLLPVLVSVSSVYINNFPPPLRHFFHSFLFLLAPSHLLKSITPRHSLLAYITYKMMSVNKWVPIAVSLICPPLAVFMCDGFGKSFFVNVFFCCCIWFPGVLHALHIVGKTRFKEGVDDEK